MSALLLVLWLGGCGADCTTSWYADLDGDGFGDRAARTLACERPPATVADATDCDDADQGVNPDAEDVCNSRDDDCDGDIDEDGDIEVYYLDADRDGMGTAASSWSGCGALPPPLYTAVQAGDCDDLDFHVRPGRSESCNGIDDDCDGLIDEGAVDVQPFFVDVDLDGHGGEETIYVCPSQQGELASEQDDCDDNDEAIYPGAAERCNGIDDDCDGLVDERAADATTGYVDRDFDGVGDALAPVNTCTMYEVIVYDYWYAQLVPTPGDCDDFDPTIHPNALERCNGYDDDCDGLADDDDPSVLVSDLSVWHVDFDRDGWGVDDAWVQACEQPAGQLWSLDGGDCDDGDDEIRPDAQERCNGYDDDCDGFVDADDSELATCP